MMRVFRPFFPEEDENNSNECAGCKTIPKTDNYIIVQRIQLITLMGIQFPWFLREVQEGYAAKGGQQNNKAYQFATGVPEAILWSDKNITIRHDSEI